MELGEHGLFSAAPSSRESKHAQSSSFLVNAIHKVGGSYRAWNRSLDPILVEPMIQGIEKVHLTRAGAGQRTFCDP